jgi:hypothetical protein
MSTPTTEPGQRLLDAIFILDDGDDKGDIGAAIVDIEVTAARDERRRLIGLVTTTMRTTTRRFPMATVELREAAAALLDAFARDGHA